MALDIGELVGKLRVDDKGMEKGLKKGEANFKEFGSKVSKLAFGIGAAAATALVGGLLGALDQQAVGAKIAAKLGGSSEDAQHYGEIAGKLYAEGWGESVQAIGDTLKAVASAKILPDGTPEELEDIARRAQILADVFGQDVNGSVRAVQQLLRNGLVPSAQEGFDLIAGAIQGGLDKSDDLLDTINEYSTEFRELGINGYQAFGLLQQAVQAGARDTDTAADALKEFAIRSKDMSASSMSAFKALGIDGKKATADFAAGGERAANGLDLVIDRLKAVKDPAEQNAIAVQLFGTKAEDLGNALFAMDLDTAGAAFNNVAGSIDKAGEAVSNTDAAKLETFKREAQQAATAFAADLIPSLEKAGKFLQENAGWIKPVTAGLIALAGGIMLVNVAMKAWTAATVAWSAVTKVAAAIQWLFNTALLANPITWIVLAIVALIAVIVLIATKTDWFQKLWGWAWGGIKAAALAVWGWIKGTLWPGIKAVFSAIGAVAMWLWHNIFEPVFKGIAAWAAYGQRIISSWAHLLAYLFMVIVAQPLLWLWHNVAEPAFQGIAAAAMWLWGSVLSPVFSAIWTGIKAVGAAAAWLWNEAIWPAFKGIGAAASWLWQNAIMPAVNGIAAAAKWLWSNAISPVWNAIVAGTNFVGDIIRSVFGRVSGWISSAFSGAAGIVRGAMNGVIGAINGAISGINWVIDKANSVPGVNFPHIPSIPRLATGGVVAPRPGGTPVIMGDGGEVEYGVPKSDMESIIGAAVRAGGGSGHAEVRVQVELVGDGVLKIVRTEVRRNGPKTLERTP